MITLRYGFCSENYSDVVMLKFPRKNCKVFVQIAYLRTFLKLLTKFVVFFNTRQGLYRDPPRDAPRGGRLSDTDRIFEIFLHAIAAQLAGIPHEARVATGLETPSPEGSAGVRRGPNSLKLQEY